MTNRKALAANLVGLIAIITIASIYHSRATSSSTSIFVPLRFHAAIRGAADAYALQPALITAVIHAESNFNPSAQSYRGAKGLMQINPPTQRYLRLKNAFDPRENIDAGSRYLRELINRFDGDLPLALAAYNAGPGAVARHGGIPPYRETQKYVKKVLAYYHYYSQAIGGDPLFS